MEKVTELAKCVKCSEFSAVDTNMALATNPSQYQFECQHCHNKQFIWGSFVYRVPTRLIGRMKEDECKSDKYDRLKEIILDTERSDGKYTYVDDFGGEGIDVYDLLDDLMTIIEE